jgi:hypothetical protein
MRVETIEFITLTILNVGLIYFKKNNASIYGITK